MRYCFQIASKLNIVADIHDDGGVGIRSLRGFLVRVDQFAVEISA